MRVRILGSSAGGGLPQWNCGCANCRAARGARASLARRTQSSVAVSADGVHWVLLNCSPDVRTQLADHDDLGPPTGVARGSAVSSIVITSADIDHVAGLLVLREGGGPSVYATEAVQHALREGLRMFDVLSAYGTVTVRSVRPGVAFQPEDRFGRRAGLELEAFALTGRAPLYMRARGVEHFADDHHVIGLEVRTPGAAGSVLYAPGVAALDDELARRIQRASLVLIDGTCFTDDELVALGMSTRTSRAMGHVPLDGSDGMLAFLSRYNRAVIVLVHVNNTNPVLTPAFARGRAAMEPGGIRVACDGDEYWVSREGEVTG